MSERTILSVLVVVVVAVATACSGRVEPYRPAPREPVPPAPYECDPASSAPVAEPLTWKRVSAFTADVASALGLTPSGLCTEVGVYDCTDLHRVALGGNDPFELAQYEPVGSPLATTPSAVDRVALGACEQAVSRDAGGAPSVFVDLVPSDELADPNAARDQAGELVRRFLARDAQAAELDVLAELASDEMGAPRTARETDVLICFAIASSSEMVLF
ncbi:MAG: hypothetical protein AB7S26_03495 [Sandaracinaceae bacterium]